MINVPLIVTAVNGIFIFKVLCQMVWVTEILVIKHRCVEWLIFSNLAFFCLQFFSSVTFPRFGSFPYLTSYQSTSIAMLMNLLSRYDISIGPNELFCLVNMTNSEKQLSSFKCSATLNKKRDQR